MFGAISRLFWQQLFLLLVKEWCQFLATFVESFGPLPVGWQQHVAATQYKTTEFEHCFCQYLENNIPDIRLIPLDHGTYVFSVKLLGVE